MVSYVQDVEDAEAGNPADKAMILQAAANVAGGFAALNMLVSQVLRSWMQSVARDIIRVQAKGSGPQLRAVLDCTLLWAADTMGFSTFADQLFDRPNDGGNMGDFTLEFMGGLSWAAFGKALYEIAAEESSEYLGATDGTTISARVQLAHTLRDKEFGIVDEAAAARWLACIPVGTVPVDVDESFTLAKLLDVPDSTRRVEAQYLYEQVIAEWSHKTADGYVFSRGERGFFDSNAQREQRFRQREQSGKFTADELVEMRTQLESRGKPNSNIRGNLLAAQYKLANLLNSSQTTLSVALFEEVARGYANHEAYGAEHPQTRKCRLRASGSGVTEDSSIETTHEEMDNGMSEPAYPPDHVRLDSPINLADGMQVLCARALPLFCRSAIHLRVLHMF